VKQIRKDSEQARKNVKTRLKTWLT
jgi:hypothetical protein